MISIKDSIFYPWIRNPRVPSKIKSIVPMNKLNTEVKETNKIPKKVIGSSLYIINNEKIGSGTIISPDGLVLTAKHVAPEQDSPYIKVVHISKDYDLALLKLPEGDNPYTFMKMHSCYPKNGEIVHTTGVRGLTTGQIVRNIKNEDNDVDLFFNQMFTTYLNIDNINTNEITLSTNDVSHGDSGSALVDSSGQGIYGVTIAGFQKQMQSKNVEYYIKLKKALLQIFILPPVIRNVKGFCVSHTTKAVFETIEKAGISINKMLDGEPIGNVARIV